jgi:hypothetical protein
MVALSVIALSAVPVVLITADENKPAIVTEVQAQLGMGEK